jgi:hypothetical protein
MSTSTHNNHIGIYFIGYFNDRFPSNAFFNARLYFTSFKAVMKFNLLFEKLINVLLYFNF